MADKYLGGCAAAAQKFGLETRCCGSCHEEEEELGYRLTEIATDDGYYEVCCGVKIAHEELQKNG